MTRKMGLGKGASALFVTPTELATGNEKPEQAGAESLQAVPEVDENTEGIREVGVDEIHAGGHQARKVFDESSLEELTVSVRAKGVIIPLLVRKEGDGFELIAGERRWRAAKRAGLETVPVIVREEDENEVHEISLIENIQRENLNSVEEAGAYRTLMDRFGYTQEQLAKRLGRDRSTIANLLRLLKLPQSVLDDISAGKLSAGHARALLALDTEEIQAALRDRIIDENLSVRETERLVAHGKEKKQTKKSASAKKGDDSQGSFPYPWVLEQLRGKLATKVGVRGSGEKGVIEIHYYSTDDLTRIIELIGG